MIWQIAILVLYVISLTVILLFSLGQAFLIYFYLKSKKATPEKISIAGDLPIITIQLPLFNELYVTERLLNAVCSLDYPKDKLEIQVLDDSTDDSLLLTKKLVAEKLLQGFDIKQITRSKNIGFKAGALQNGLNQAKGELIAIFDADFLPESDFLTKLIPYFNNPKIGMVQSRWGHINEDYSLLTQVQGFGLDGHFTVEQTGRNSAHLFMNFNGTAGIWRKKCIVEAGGWQHDTLTEDLDLSYRAQLKGWEFKYVEEITTPAELPVALNAFKSQQHRWTKGAIETSKKMLSQVWKANVGLKRKIFASLHLLNSYAFLFIFLTSVLSIPVLLIKNNTEIPLIYFQFLTVYVIGFLVIVVFYLIASLSKHKNYGTFIKLFPMFLSVSLALSFHNTIAVLEGVFNFKSDFIRTPKFNVTTLKDNFKSNIYVQHKLPASFYMEVFLCFYFLTGIIGAFYYHDFGLLPFHLMLFTGFCVLNFYSVKGILTK
ncbi:cellulose synthase family protein [Pedobacter arcticus]|uniref:cellulose synthase family protein n=1 Tax=Pedobacter arcticus TaxID=752140 RepID=UPI0003098ECB|nr:cellulose synthase family protein [Pedobacter arcticus]